MAYTDQAALIAVYGAADFLALADRDGDDTIDSEVIAAAIDRAAAEVDAYLGARFVVPLAEPVPTLVASVTMDIARYRLMGENPLDEARERYRRAIALLEGWRDGKLMLPAAERSPEQGISVATTRGERDRVFTRDTLAGF